MKFLLNLIWLIFGGLILALSYALAGLVMCILIITIPFGIQAFKLSAFALWPFGSTVIKRPDAGGFTVVGNIIWLIIAGWWIAIAHIVTAVVQAITIIGIPLAIANIKLVPIALWPFGRQIVSTDSVEAQGGIAVPQIGSQQ